jgi:hypothetical protein
LRAVAVQAVVNEQARAALQRLRIDAARRGTYDFYFRPTRSERR